MGNINALPSIDKLTSSDGGNVKKLIEQYETLKQDDREKVTNSALLLAAFERITAIEKQMADVEAMIKEKLEGVTVTLDTKEDIQAIDKAMEGLASTDVAKITAAVSYTHLISPFVVCVAYNETILNAIKFSSSICMLSNDIYVIQ